MNNQTNNKIIKKRNNNKIMLTIVCIIVSILLVFSITLGIVFGIRNARSIVSLSGTGFDEGEVNYLISYYKYEFIGALASLGITAYDSDEFWESEYDENGKTYGQLLTESTYNYIKDIAVKNYIFNRYCSISSYDRNIINKTANEVLDYKAGNSVDKFNAECEKFGFDFADLCDAVEILYKASIVKSLIYGVGGQNLSMESELCEDFFAEYTHVKLLFIRTEQKFLLDSEGNRVPDEEGNDTLIDLTDGEKAERQSVINEIRAQIDAFKNDTDSPQMSPEQFNSFIAQYDDGDPSKRNTGYYFHPSSEYTQQFSEVFANIVDKSYSLDIGEYGEVAFDGGVCFIYKYENTYGAYADTEDYCFSDFFPLLADKSFSELEREFGEKVKFKESLYSIDLTRIPYNNEFIFKF